jgi:hypothetical protein
VCAQRALLLAAYGGEHHEYATAVNNVATLYQVRLRSRGSGTVTVTVWCVSV